MRGQEHKEGKALVGTGPALGAAGAQQCGDEELRQAAPVPTGLASCSLSALGLSLLVCAVGITGVTSQGCGEALRAAGHGRAVKRQARGKGFAQRTVSFLSTEAPQPASRSGATFP